MIVGYSISYVNAEKFEIKERIEKLDINTSLNIKDINEVSFQQENKQKKVLKVDFEFLVNYNPKIADIRIEGYVIYDGKDLDDILKKWRKDKKIEDKEFEIEVKNFILRRCIIFSTFISEYLAIHPPIPLPQIIPKQ
ncbi:MAG: hypothetical protein QW197_02075 [Candidatus Aenigmatarchaeota archaeon]